MFTAIPRDLHLKRYPVMLNSSKKKIFTEAQSMFGKGVFTMNRQEENNFFFATEQSISS